MSEGLGLLPCLVRLGGIQHESVDRVAVHDAVTALETEEPQAMLDQLLGALYLPEATWLPLPDPARVPALVHDAGRGWGVLRGRNASGQWVVEFFLEGGAGWQEERFGEMGGFLIAVVKLSRPFAVGSSPSWQLIVDEMLVHKKWLVEVAIGGAAINLVALATSFYSMHVYNRVVPTGALSTLLVLTLGVTFAIAYEFVARLFRSRLYDGLVESVDRRLAHAVYARFLSLRLDQLPRSVGSLAAQIRGYETVRAFMTYMTTHLLVDAPFALLFMVVIASLAGPLAVIPVVFFAVTIGVGLLSKKRIDSLAVQMNRSSYLKTGLLVETVEGAETIKAGHGGWRMLGRWVRTTDEARDAELGMRSISERSQFLTAAFQQASYVLMVAFGALLVSRGELTMGGLIACSILSGRVLSPVGMIPGQIVQWSSVKDSLKGLDQLWKLEDDHFGIAEPLVLEQVAGAYRLESVVVDYGGFPVLTVPKLSLAAGEKIGVIGPIGAGKTTLLRVLSGMYKPGSGRVFLDNVDLSQISKPVLSEQMGYVQQDARLFAGTLRENLVIGLIDPGDEVLLKTAQLTGLMERVVAQHPQGLQLPIFEGGIGLSSGQRQLVNLTRSFLRQPSIWLLDEPTASMDRALEVQVVKALKERLRASDTMVLVTHKGELLELVDRLIVIANHGVVLDGPKEEVLRKLGAGSGQPAQGGRGEVVRVHAEPVATEAV